MRKNDRLGRFPGLRVIGAGRLPPMTEWQIGLTYPLTVAGAATDGALFAVMRRTTFPLPPIRAPCPRKICSVILLLVQQTCAWCQQSQQKRHAQMPDYP